MRRICLRPSLISNSSPALNGGDVAQLAATFAHFAGGTEIHTLGFQQRFIEGREIEAVGAILLDGDVAAGADNFGFPDIAQFLDLGKQICSFKHEIFLVERV
jgi:hypothetical protein